MLMKQHSYTSYNIDLHYKLAKLKAFKALEKKEDGVLSESDIIELNDLEAELNRGGATFPANQTLPNFFDFLLVPTLVYELGYPRTAKFRFWYFAERVFAAFATIGLLYFVVEHQVNPVLLGMSTQSYLDSYSNLLLPFMTWYFII